MKYRSYKKWNKKGFYVNKGEKSRIRNKKGTPMFGSDQVTRKEDSPYFEGSGSNYRQKVDYDESDYEIGAYELGFDWA